MMSIEALVEESERSGGVTVSSSSGKLYKIERDVITANSKEVDPFIYGWPLHPNRRRGNNPVWFKASNVKLIEPSENNSPLKL